MFDIRKDINNNNYNIFSYIIIKCYIFGYEYLCNYNESKTNLNAGNYYFFTNYPNIKKSPYFNFEISDQKNDLFPGIGLIYFNILYINMKNWKKNEKWN